MDFDDGKRVVRRRFGLWRIHYHRATRPQQVLTTHSRHFGSHADPGRPHRRGPGRGLPLPGGRAAGQHYRRRRAQMGRIVTARQAEDLRLAVPRTGLVQRVGRRRSLAEAARTQHTQEGFLKLLTGAGVDDGVDAAVEIAQPERYLEDCVRGSVRWEDGT